MHPANSRRSYDSYPNEIPRKTLIDEAIQEQLLDEIPYKHMPYRKPHEPYRKPHDILRYSYFDKRKIAGYMPMGEAIVLTHIDYNMSIPKGDADRYCQIFEMGGSNYSLIPKWILISSHEQVGCRVLLRLEIGKFYCRTSTINNQYKVQKFRVDEDGVEWLEWLQH